MALALPARRRAHGARAAGSPARAWRSPLPARRRGLDSVAALGCLVTSSGLVWQVWATWATHRAAHPPLPPAAPVARSLLARGLPCGCWRAPPGSALGRALAAAGRGAEAEAAFEAAVRAEPAAAEWPATLSRMMAARGRCVAMGRGGGAFVGTSALPPTAANAAITSRLNRQSFALPEQTAVETPQPTAVERALRFLNRPSGESARGGLPSRSFRARGGEWEAGGLLGVGRVRAMPDHGLV